MVGYIGYRSEYDLGGINSLSDTANSIVRDGLTLYIDAANINSYNPRENLVSHSYYNASTWNNIFPAGASITTGIDAPDGSLNAVRFSGTNTTQALLRVGIPSITPNGTDPYTISFYVRKISGTTGTFRTDFADGTPQLDYIGQLVTNQWVRIVNSGVPAATARTFIDIFNGSTTNHVVDFWGLQLERGSVATDYVQTEGSIVSGSGKTTWFDLSGQNNHLTMVGFPIYASNNGGVVYFNGSNYAQNSLNYSTSSFTIMASSRYSGATRQRLISSVSNNWIFGHWSNGAERYFAEGWIKQDPGFNDTNWRIFTGVENFSSDQRSFYVNNYPIVLNSSSGSNGFNGLSLGRSGVYGENSTCEVGFVLVYNRLLSTEEITRNYNVFRGRYSL